MSVKLVDPLIPFENLNIKPEPQQPEPQIQPEDFVMSEKTPPIEESMYRVALALEKLVDHFVTN